MAVTKQTYTVTATWTAAQLADSFRSAFIDAGLMTDWYDSFLNGTIENRILEVTYDAAKTYGKTYCWFMFTTAGFYINHAAAWNSTTHVPTGTAGVEFTIAATNSIGNHLQCVSMAAATTSTIVRYTSAVNTNESWFLVRNGTNSVAFIVDKGVTAQSYVNLDKQFFPAFNIVAANNPGGSNHRGIGFRLIAGCMRKSYFASGNTYNFSNATQLQLEQYVYAVTAYSYSYSSWGEPKPVFLLPVAFSAANSSFTTDSVPICTNLRRSLYTNAQLSTDFGIMPHFPSAAMTTQDRMIVTPSSEEWEILVVSPGDGSNIPSLLFVARVV